LFSGMSRPDIRPMQPDVQWVLAVNRSGHDAVYLHLVQRLRMMGALPPPSLICVPGVDSDTSTCTLCTAASKTLTHGTEFPQVGVSAFNPVRGEKYLNKM
jgi:hypothetical protein